MDINKIKTINLKTSKKSGPKGSKSHKCYGPIKCPHCAVVCPPVKAYPMKGGTLVKYAHPPIRPKHDDSGELAFGA